MATTTASKGKKNELETTAARAGARARENEANIQKSYVGVFSMYNILNCIKLYNKEY